MATIEQFLKEYEVPFESNTNWVLADGSKNGYTLKWNRPSEDVKDSNVSSKWINVFQKYCKSPIWTLDCDDKEMGLDETIKRVTEAFGFTPPYTLSSTKKLPHFYLAIENCPITTDISQGILKICKGDLIKVSVEERNAIVYENKELEVLDWNDIKAHFTFEDKKKKKLIVKSKVEPSNSNKKNNINKSGMEELLFIIDPNKINYNDYIKVVIAYAEECGKDGLDSFLEWNSQYSGANMEADEKTYLSFIEKQNDVSIGTLRFIAKRENPKGFQEWSINNGYELTWHMVTTYSQAELAEFYSKIVEKGYVFSNNCWYWWNNSNIIKRGTKNHPDSLKVAFHDEMNSRLDKLIKNLDKTAENYREKLQTALAFHKKMGQSTFVNGIIDYLRSYYSDEEFSKKIDTNMNLVAFTNCVYDNKIKKTRPIEKHDYIMKNTGYDYKPAKQEHKHFIMTQILKMMDTQEMVDYLIDTLAVALVDNTYEQFYCHTGSGGNGKGLLFTLLRNSLGDYYYQAPNEFYTTPYRADAPNSSLSKAKGCRFFVTSEPSSEDTGGRKMKLSTDLIKTLTGRDPINARDLYQSAEEFIPTFTSFLQCNIIPQMKIDGGMRRRFRKIDYPNRFVENPNPDKPKEKQIDVTLKDKFALYEYHLAFMEILFDRLKNFTKFVIPQSAIDSTNAKMNDMDYVMAWLDDFTESSDDKYYRTEAYTDFLKDMGLTKQDMSNTTFFSQMEAKDISQVKNKGIRYFKGIKRIITENEDNECQIEKDL